MKTLDLTTTDFHTEPRPVKGPDNQNYLLCEPSAADAIKFQNLRSNKQKFEDGVLVDIVDAYDLQLELVSICLFKTNGNGERTGKLPQEVFEKWGNLTVEALWEAAKPISGLYRPINTLPELWKEALELASSPVNRLELAKFLANLDPKFQPLTEQLVTEEELVKNELEPSKGGLE